MSHRRRSRAGALRVIPPLSVLTVAALTGGCAATAASGPAGYGTDVTTSQAAPAAAADGGVIQTEWGPLSAADRALLTKVRQASLWEMPMAQQAQQRGQNARVRVISREIAVQHMALDAQVRSVAAKLKVRLPAQPSTGQQDWMTQIEDSQGAAYDTTYVGILRLAHGQVFSLIGAVRGSTQNTLMRGFADAANAAVLNHMRLLESTGLTDAGSFPSPPTPT